MSELSGTCHLVGTHVFNTSDEQPGTCVYCGAEDTGDAAVVTPVAPALSEEVLAARARWRTWASTPAEIEAAWSRPDG